MAENTLQIVWEDNPDTPLKASNISKIVQSYKEDDLLFIDTNDSKLKLRANSKISMKVKNTSAFFDFNRSFATNDSSDYFYPVQHDNLSFRREGPREDNLYSLAIESNTSNLLINSNFSSGLNSWTTSTSGSSVINTEDSKESLFGSCVKMVTDSFPHPISMSQNKLISIQQNFSVSFYYKSDKPMKFQLMGNPNLANKWLRDIDWITQEYYFDLPSTSGVWKRYEIKNIPSMSGLIFIEEVKLLFYSDSISCTSYIANVQLEYNDYCSSYTSTSRNNPVFLLRKDSIRIDQGMIDLEMRVNSFNTERNYILYTETADRPAMKLYFDVEEKKLVFSVLNLSSNLPEITDPEVNYVKCEYQFDVNTFTALINKWIRVLISWDFTLATKEMRIYIYNDISTSQFEFIPSATDFTTCTDSDITRLSFGGTYSSADNMLFEGLIKNLKFNLFSKSAQKINYDLARGIYPEENDYKLYEVANKNVVINDISSFNPLSTHYIWLCIDLDNHQDANIIVNTSSLSPYNYYHHFSKVIGCFNTDTEANIISNSLVDMTIVGSKHTQLKIENTMPTDIGKNGEIRILNTINIKKTIIYLDNVGWA